MEEKDSNQKNSQQRYHEVLLKILNNIGIVGVILTSIADIIFVIIFVVGVEMNVSLNSTIIFAIINAVVGVIINILLRFQGQKYAEIENKDLCDKFYRKKVKESKFYLSMGAWQILKAFTDIIIKGGITVFSIFGIVYISIEGSKNPIQILITIANLALFICFGLINMNSSYYRFYNVQVPYMELKTKKEGDKQNGDI